MRNLYVAAASPESAESLAVDLESSLGLFVVSDWHRPKPRDPSYPPLTPALEAGDRLQQIRRCDVFVLIANSEPIGQEIHLSPSSCLVETGYALRVNRTIFILGENPPALVLHYPGFRTVRSLDQLKREISAAVPSKLAYNEFDSKLVKE